MATDAIVFGAPSESRPRRLVGGVLAERLYRCRRNDREMRRLTSCSRCVTTLTRRVSGPQTQAS
jgi:hypothetical protein